MDLRLGDCLIEMKGIPDGTVDAIITDLPYGTTACKWDVVIPFAPMWAQVKRLLKKNGVFVTTASQPFTSALIMSNPKMFKYCWVWEKTRASNPYLAKIQPLRSHEDVAIFGLNTPLYYPQKTVGGKYTISRLAGGRVAGDRKSNNANYSGKTQSGRYPRTVQKISNSSAEAGLHPTQKPVALIEYLIKTYTNEGEAVLDFCMGSGTTGVACVHTGRHFIGIELDEKYFNIAKRRIEETDPLFKAV